MDDGYATCIYSLYHTDLSTNPIVCTNSSLKWYSQGMLLPKAQVVFLIKICPLSVVVVVVVVVVNFSHFHLLLQNHWANFNQTWHKASLGEEDSNLFKRWAPPSSKARKLGKSKNILTKFNKSSSQEPLDKFQPNLAQSILG